MGGGREVEMVTAKSTSVTVRGCGMALSMIKALECAGWNLLRQAAQRTAAFGFAALAACAVILPSPAHAECAAPRELIHFKSPLPTLQRAMRSEPAVRIAALGSSSTEGVGASSRKMCYPARLEAELNRRHGQQRTFSVANLGVGGEMATDMLARIDTEVLPLAPHLVIWQTGVNDAIHGISIDDFRTTLVQGIQAIRASGADIVLLGMQYYPKSARVALYKDYIVTMREVANELNVPLLNRFAIMKHFVETAQYTPAQLLAPDLFHQNDFSYGCMSRLLVDAIDDGLGLGTRRSAANATNDAHPRIKLASAR